MSRYVVLIKAVAFYPVGEILKEPLNLYALTTSNHPPTGLERLSDCSPINLTLVHSIYSANRTDYLLRTLQIKFIKQLSHSFWYHFTAEHVDFITGINQANLSSMIGLIHKAERKPEKTVDEVNKMLAEGLAKADGALT